MNLAWIYDGIIDYSLISEDNVSNSIIQYKKGYFDNKIIKVKCFDFSKFLEKFKEYGQVIVKMDIEGAEYEILDKVINDGNDDIITILLCEFHLNKFNNEEYRKKMEIISEKIHKKFGSKLKVRNE